MKQFKGFERKEQIDFSILPKGAYNIKLLNVKEEHSEKGYTYLKIAFDIAEGEYANFYKNMFDANTNEDKKWNNDAVIYLSCPDDDSEQWVIDNFNKFITAVENSNEGYSWDWDENKLKDKIVGAKFCNEQSEYNGKIYDHTKAKWFIPAQKIREGKIGRLPNDKIIAATPSATSADFVNIPEGIAEEIPF